MTSLPLASSSRIFTALGLSEPPELVLHFRRSFARSSRASDTFSSDGLRMQESGLSSH